MPSASRKKRTLSRDYQVAIVIKGHAGACDLGKTGVVLAQKFIAPGGQIFRSAVTSMMRSFDILRAPNHSARKLSGSK